MRHVIAWKSSLGLPRRTPARLAKLINSASVSPQVPVTLQKLIAWLTRGQAAKRLFAPRQLVDHTRYGIHISTGRQRLAFEQLRGGVTRGPDVEAVAAQVRKAGGLSREV